MKEKSKRPQRFPEAVSVYLPRGTKERLENLPAEHGIRCFRHEVLVAAA